MNSTAVRILCIGAAIIATACSKNIDTVDSGSETLSAEGLVDMTFSVQADDLSKTALSAGNKVFWLPGDNISVFDSAGRNNKFISSVTSPSASSGFQGKISAGSTKCHSLFPYNPEASFDAATETFTTTVPSVQTVTYGSFCSDANVTVGSFDIGSSKAKRMYNALSVIKFIVNDNDIKEIRIAGFDGEKIAGAVGIEYNGGFPICTPAESAEAQIAIKPHDGVFVPGKPYYATLIPTVFKRGYYVTMIDTSERVYKVVCPSEVEFNLCEIRNAGALSKAAAIEDNPPRPTGKPIVCWVDAAANFNDYGNDTKAIWQAARKIRQTGFTHVVVDVRPTTGDVLYNSSVAPHLNRIDAWIPGEYVWLYRSRDFDYLQTWIDAGHAMGLNVYASMNTFTGAYLCPYGLGSQGFLLSDSGKKSWGTVINTSNGLVNTADQLDDTKYYGTKFLNPANDEVRTYLLNIINEIASYDIDGLILDRCRYSDEELKSDFSNVTRQKFSSFGGTTTQWPGSVFAAGSEELSTSTTRTPTITNQKKFITFRAKMIHDFIESASNMVHATNPDCKFGVYVGAWYSDFYKEGVNYASPNYDPSGDGSFGKWANSDYKNYGYADHCDVIFIGCYAPSDQIYGSTDWTMEGFVKLDKPRITRNLGANAPLVIGGPDIGNTTGSIDGDKGALLYDTMDAIINKGGADGYFVFDLIHIKKFDYWDSYADAINRIRN